MVRLITMSEEQLKTFAAHSIAGYAQDIEQTYGLTPSLALEQATEGFNELLPDGLNTSGHHLFSLRASSGEDVGVLWFGIDSAYGIKKLFIYDLEIHPQARRYGHGKKALEQVERWARANGVKRIELNVFAKNKAGLALYSMCGLDPYEITLGKYLD